MIISTLISVLVVSCISLVGILLLMGFGQKLNKILPFLVSLSAGAMFGDAFIHLLPEAFEEAGEGISISIAVLVGIFAFFILEKFLRWHHCHGSEEEQHEHEKNVHVGPLVFTSDAFHNFIDGVIIAAAYFVSLPVGIATTVAVILHEIPQELGDFGLMVHSGFSPKKALGLNFLSALTAVLGAVITIIIGSQIESAVPILTSFAAGSFIYIAGSDILPELHKNTNWRHSLIQLIFIIIGVVAMVALLGLE